MNTAHTLTFNTFRGGKECRTSIVTRLLPNNWKESKGWQHVSSEVAVRHGLPQSATLHSSATSQCWRSTLYAYAMRVVPNLELELLDEINLIAEARQVSVNQAFRFVAEEYDAQGDIRAGVLWPVYERCQCGLTLGQALREVPLFSAGVRRVLILTEGVPAQNRAAGKLAAERMARKCNSLWAILGGAVKMLLGLVGHSK